MEKTMMSSEILTGDDISTKTTDTPRKHLRMKLIEKIIVFVFALTILISVLSGVAATAEKKQEIAQTRVRENALTEAIEPIMEKYGISVYRVEDYYSSYEVFAFGFENLTFGRAIALLEELDGFHIDDPCGKGSICLSSYYPRIYPGINTYYYSYWIVPRGRTSSAFPYAGLWTDIDGENECIFKFDY